MYSDTGSGAFSVTAAASSSSSTSILSEKVQRALQLRTDTPAMKAALDALGQLEGTLDARSVRHAMEYDALQQALHLRTELRGLCGTLQELRQGISETAHTAHRVQQAIHTPVVVVAHGQDTVSPAVASDGTVLAPEQDEERLAAHLADAFAKRSQCVDRLAAVHQFLELFDLSDQDSRLLEHYNFEDLTLGQSQTPVHGVAFLKALERVKEIRQALSQTFGMTTSRGGGEASALLAQSSSSSSSSSLGASSALRMMEQLAQKQEQAYERLYQWLQSHLQLFAASSSTTTNKKNPAQHKKIAFVVEDDDNDPAQEDVDSMDRALQHPFVQAALHTLQNVPAFYKHLLELLASRRRQEETRLFLLALTVGHAGLPPMERLAHDPVAYVGDILAFAFRSLSTEADVATTIVHYDPQPNDKEQGDEPDNKEEEGEEDNTAPMEHGGGAEEDYYNTEKPMSASDMLSTSLSGMARPLKSRIVGVITQLASRVVGKHNRAPEGGDVSDGESDDGVLDDFEEEGATVRHKLTHLYEICGLLLFYRSAYTKTIVKVEQADRARGLMVSLSPDVDPTTSQGNNALLVNVTACLTEGVKALEATVRVYSAMMGSLSLSSGESVAALAKALLVRIAEVRQASPGFAETVPCPDPECETTLSTTWISTQVVDAALPFCSSLDDMAELNQALDTVQSAGMAAKAARTLKERMEETQQALVDKLVQEETSKVLQTCGLAKLVSAWEQWNVSLQQQQDDEETTPLLMASYPGLSAEEVAAATQAFYGSLYSPPLPSLEADIKDPDTRKATRTQIAAQVCRVYRQIYEDLIDPTKGGYGDLQTLMASFLGHTPEQVDTLFAV